MKDWQENSVRNIKFLYKERFNQELMLDDETIWREYDEMNRSGMKSQEILEFLQDIS